MGQEPHHGTDPFTYQGQVPELHARPDLPEQVPDHRRSPEPDSKTDEDSCHPSGSRNKNRLSWPYRAKRYSLPYRRQFGPDVCGRSIQRLAACRAHYIATRRTLSSCRLCKRSAVTSPTSSTCP